jgi:hypothetical protein
MPVIIILSAGQTRGAIKINQGDLPELIGAVSRLDGIMTLYLGITV